MQNNFSREKRWEYHAADRGVNAKDSAIRNVFNAHGVSVWTEVLWFRVRPDIWLSQCVGVDFVVCEESSIGFLTHLFSKVQLTRG